MRCALALVLTATALLGAAEPTEPVAEFSLASLKQRAQEVEQVRIQFRQIKELELFDSPVVTEGLLDISRPLASVRWEFTDRAVLVLRKGFFQRWRADGTRESTGNGPAVQALQGQMQALLTGDWESLDRLFTIHLEHSERQLRLEPRDADLARYVTSLELSYRPSLIAPERMIIHAPGGDRTIYEFAEPEDPGAFELARFAEP